VPVYASNNDYTRDGPAPADERKERDRIYREALEAKLPAGTVHVYITAPDGHILDSQHVATAAQVEKLTEMLERTVERLQTKPGKPLAAPTVQSKMPKADADALVLHVTARNLVKKGDDFVPAKTHLGETRSGSWGAYPGEDWLVLSKTEWTKLLPAGEASVGTTWEPDREVLAQLLRYFYPSSENNDVQTNRIEKQEAKGTILTVKDGVATARLDGTLRMRHPFYHKEDDKAVEATFVGVLEFDVNKGKVRALQVATERAVYGGQSYFGVAVRSVP
jgi:hypothetical protein